MVTTALPQPSFLLGETGHKEVLWCCSIKVFGELYKQSDVLEVDS